MGTTSQTAKAGGGAVAVEPSRRCSLMGMFSYEGDGGYGSASLVPFHAPVPLFFSSRVKVSRT